MKANLWIDAMCPDDKADRFGDPDAPPATPLDDRCTCGHVDTEHRASAEGYPGCGPCTVCTCNHFDWDLDR